MTYKEQEIATTVVRYKALVVDTYGNPPNEFPSVKELPGVYDSWDEALQEIKKYYKNNPPISVTNYDLGGYISCMTYHRAHNPKTSIDFDEPEKCGCNCNE